MPETKTRTRMMLLECELTDDEVRDRAFEAGQADQEIQKLEAEFDDVKATHKAKVKTHETRRRDLLREVRTRKTSRDVEVRIELAYAPDFVVRMVRTDTGETIHERPMTQDERQIRLLDEARVDEDADRIESSAG